MAASTRGITKSLLPPPKTRAAMAKRLAGATAAMTTATISEMEERHTWFRELDADYRSWVGVVARAGIDGFVTWFADPDPDSPTTTDIFGAAPRALTRKISLSQTVELVRTTIDVVEAQIDEVAPRGDRPVLHAAIVGYSREVAFAAAEIYARAAELRGAWDARLEALVVDAVLRGETDETVLSRASTLGWRSSGGVVVVVGPAPENEAGPAVESVRHTAAIAGLDMLGAVQGDRLVVVLGGSALTDPEFPRQVVSRFVDCFGSGPVVIGPPVEHLMDAAASTREAFSGYRAAPGLARGASAGRGLGPAAGTCPLRRRPRPPGAGPRPVRPPGRRRRRAARHTGHVPGPGPAGRGGRAGVVRAREHGPLPPAPHPRGHRLLPHRPPRRLRPPPGPDPGPAAPVAPRSGPHADDDGPPTRKACPPWLLASRCCSAPRTTTSTSRARGWRRTST